MAVENENDQQIEDAKNLADEEAGFAEVFGEEPPVRTTAGEDTETDAHTDEPDADDETESEEGEEDDEPEEGKESDESQAEKDQAYLEKLLGSIPDLNERSELTATQLRQVQGKLGEINRVIQDLKNNPAATEPVKIDKAAFKKLGEEFPEIAEMLAEDLAGISLQTNRAEQPDITPVVEAKMAEARAEMQQQLEIRLLTMQHRDWRTVVKTQGFQEWVATLPAEDQEKLNNSWEAEYIGDKLTEYKASSQDKQKRREERNKRLTRGLMPRGVGKPAKTGLTTEEDGFNAAFN
jgi:hypothetical protein